jgi:hypothetical protein
MLENYLKNFCSSSLLLSAENWLQIKQRFPGMYCHGKAIIVTTCVFRYNTEHIKDSQENHFITLCTFHASRGPGIQNMLSPVWDKSQ